METLQKMGTGETYLNIVKAMYDKPTENIILNSEKLKVFLLKSGQDKGSHSHHYIQQSFGSPATAIIEEKK